MSVDMLVPRFFREVERLYSDGGLGFERQGRWDRTVANCPVPPYRAVFTAGLLFGHAAGYRLPSFKQFVATYSRAIRDNDKYPSGNKVRLFQNPATCGEPTPGFLHRLGGWYLDGMAHTHLYVTLVQAYEDQRRLGAVASDPRIDWKLKTDLVVMSASKMVRLNINFGNEELVGDRAVREAGTKARAMASHVTGNPFHDGTPMVEVIRDAEHTEPFRGLRFFTPACLDNVITEVDKALEVPAGSIIRYGEMRKADMRVLNARNSDAEVQQQ